MLLSTLLFARLHTHSPAENAVWRLFKNYNVPLDVCAVKLLLKSFILSQQSDYAVYTYYILRNIKIPLSLRSFKDFDHDLVELMKTCDVMNPKSLASYSVYHMLRHDMNANCILLLLPEISLEEDKEIETYIMALKHLASVNLWPECFAALERLHGKSEMSFELGHLYEHFFKVLSFNPSPGNSHLSNELFQSIESRGNVASDMSLMSWKYYFSLLSFDTIINHYYTYLMV